MNGMERAATFRESWRGRTCAPVCVSRIGLKGHAEQSDLVCRVVEIFVALVLPSLWRQGVSVRSEDNECAKPVRFKDLTFSVFLPTRSIPADKVPDGRGDEWPYRFGVGSRVKDKWVRRGEKRIRKKVRVLYLTGDDLASNVTEDAIIHYAPSGIKNFLDKLQLAWTVRLAYSDGFDSHGYMPVHAVVHHGNKLREVIREEDSARREAVESDFAAEGWEPDSRALHYLADLVVGTDGGYFQDIERWSCWDVQLDDARSTLEVVKLMNKAKPGDGVALGDALFRLAVGCKGGIATQSVRRLALDNLRQLAGDQWEKVVASAFRLAKTSETR
jgi:hypothetical protein